MDGEPLHRLPERVTVPSIEVSDAINRLEAVLRELERRSKPPAVGAQLDAVIGLMTWMWLSVAVILIGGKLNAEMEHQTARDTTEGAPTPIGSRRAKMADTVGAARS